MGRVLERGDAGGGRAAGAVRGAGAAGAAGVGAGFAGRGRARCRPGRRGWAGWRAGCGWWPGRLRWCAGSGTGWRSRGWRRPRRRARYVWHGAPGDLAAGWDKARVVLAVVLLAGLPWVARRRGVFGPPGRSIAARLVRAGGAAAVLVLVLDIARMEHFPGQAMYDRNEVSRGRGRGDGRCWARG